MIINHTIATVYDKAIVSAMNMNGEIVVNMQRFENSAAAHKFIREQGFRFMSRREYNQEVNFRANRAKSVK